MAGNTGVMLKRLAGISERNNTSKKSFIVTFITAYCAVGGLGCALLPFGATVC
jgi:hypothetical protein